VGRRSGWWVSHDATRVAQVEEDEACSYEVFEERAERARPA
jgi:hypothetical protein